MIAWLRSLFTPPDYDAELCEALDRFTEVKALYDHARLRGWPFHHLDMALVKARTDVLKAEQAVIRSRSQRRVA